MYYMPVVTLRVSDEEKEAWVEEAGGSRKLSEWIRGRCNFKPVALIENGRTWVPTGPTGVLAERGELSLRVAEPDPHKAHRVIGQSAPRSASARDFRTDFKQPGQKKKAR